MFSLSQVEAALAGMYGDLTVLKDQGGQGTVYRSRAADGTDVALKIYAMSQVEERSEREVVALRRLKSERIVRLHDAGRIEIGNDLFRFIATSFVEGTPLSDLISCGPLEITTAARIASDVAEAIDELWLLRIVHRDVKPENIIVTPEARAVLIDLGIARHLAHKTITTAGHTYGTWGYFAPEHLAGRPLSCKADVFATGIVFQEMLIGRHPTSRRQELLANGGPMTSTVAPALDAAVSKLIDRMVAKRAYDRPTPTRVRAVIEDYLNANVRN